MALFTELLPFGDMRHFFRDLSPDVGMYVLLAREAFELESDKLKWHFSVSIKRRDQSYVRFATHVELEGVAAWLVREAIIPKDCVFYCTGPVNPNDLVKHCWER